MKITRIFTSPFLISKSNNPLYHKEDGGCSLKKECGGKRWERRMYEKRGGIEIVLKGPFTYLGNWVN